MKFTVAVAALAVVAPHAAAQHQEWPHPADPAARVPAAQYESAFKGYRGFRDEPLAAWRDVNDEVARAGGHVGILKGAHGGPAASRPTAAPPAGRK